MMKIKVLISIVLLYLSLTLIQAQNNNYKKENYFTIISYNVENLFDTINDPNKEDDEFLPTSKKNWNSDRYKKKLKDLSRVISSINRNELPEIVGLIEVENISVLQDLVATKFLKKGDYAIVHEESPDARGIDVALIYRKMEFTYLEHEKITVNFEFEPETTTRDVLYVKGKLKNNEILHVFVNHWSSRRNGQAESEPKRLHAAALLRGKVDSIFRKDKNAKIVILGDFNDMPENKSLNEVLNASNKQNTKDKKTLYNLMYDKHLFGFGTYNYKGNWNMLDNIIVSKPLLQENPGYKISTDGGQIFSERWMLYDNVKIGYMTPNKTYGGPNYYGGVSDHFPVYVILKKE